MQNCEVLFSTDNFESLTECQSTATVEILFVGGKRKAYCDECAAPQINLMKTFNPVLGQVKFARSLVEPTFQDAPDFDGDDSWLDSVEANR